MKKYRLLKDLPWCKAGVIAYKESERHKYCIGEVLYVPDEYVQDKPEWFEEVEEEDYRWKPDMGEDYFYINFGAKRGIDVSSWDGHPFDRAMFDNYFMFRTEEQAREAMRRIKPMLKAYHKEIVEGKHA